MKMHCMKCKKAVEAKNVENKTSSNGRKMAKGVCPHCGTKVCKFTK